MTIKQGGEEKVGSAIHHCRKSGQEIKQGRILEAGADAEAMEGAAYRLSSSG